MLVRFRVTVNTPGIDRALQIYSRTVRNAMEKLGRHLQTSWRSRARKARGDEQRGVKFIVQGQQLSLTLDVFGELVQHVIDEWGLPPGTFPPWDIGSRIFNYVKRLALHRKPLKARRASSMRRASHVSTRRPRARHAAGTQRPLSSPVGGVVGRIGRARRAAAPAREQTGRAIAQSKAVRRIAFLVARKIFEHGIKARHPIAQTFKANRAKIIRDIGMAFQLATRIINKGGQA